MIEEQYLNSEKVNEVRQRNRSLRRQFLKYKDAEIVYSLTHRKLLEMADEAGAIYRVDGTVLINRDIFDEYLETASDKQISDIQDYCLDNLNSDDMVKYIELDTDIEKIFSSK